MSLRDELRDGRADVRLEAAVRAATAEDDAGLASLLLDIAVHDDTEVRTVGGLAEEYEHVGNTAAQSLRQILERRAELDPGIRAAAFDLSLDDDRVASLLYYLGPGYEPVRVELETHDEARLRLRAARAVLPFRRSAEYTARLLADGSADVRREALEASVTDVGVDTCLRLLREDPARQVRTIAARHLRFGTVGSDPFIVAARTETDPYVRAMLLSCLALRRRDRANTLAIVGFLGAAEWPVRRDAGVALRDVDDVAVASAIALRILVEPDRWVLDGLLQYRHLFKYEPRMWDVLDRLHRDTRQDGQRHALAEALKRPAPAYGQAQADEAEGLDLAQQLTARMIGAGVDPPPLGPLLRLLPERDDSPVPDPDVLVVRTSDRRWAPVEFGRPLPVGEGVRPERAAARLRCAGCGSWHRAEGAVPWSYRDDDHSGFWDDGFAGTLRGTSPGCGTAGQVRAELTVTRSRADYSGELVWDGPTG